MEFTWISKRVQTENYGPLTNQVCSFSQLGRMSIMSENLLISVNSLRDVTSEHETDRFRNRFCTEERILLSTSSPTVYHSVWKTSCDPFTGIWDSVQKNFFPCTWLEFPCETVLCLPVSQILEMIQVIEHEHFSMVTFSCSTRPVFLTGSALSSSKRVKLCTLPLPPLTEVREWCIYNQIHKLTCSNKGVQRCHVVEREGGLRSTTPTRKLLIIFW